MDTAVPAPREACDARLLRAVLDGKSYAGAGGPEGLTAAAVERRVRRLARTLQVVVGVEDIDADAWPGVDLLRQHREQYLEALSHYRPDRIVRAAPALPSAADIEKLSRMVALHCREPERAQAVLLLLFATALKPAEIARLVVADYLRADGHVRAHSVLRAEAAINRHSRPLYFTSEPAVAALDRYLSRRSGFNDRRPFRGLDPSSALILLDGADAEASIHGVLRTIFRLAWLPGLTAQAARRYAAARLREKGVAQSSIAAALGLRQGRSVLALQEGAAGSAASAMRALLPAPDAYSA